jgi:hypothetical protein
MSYAIHRSKKNNDLHLIFMETCFDDLPDHVRNQGPWQHLKRGEFENLRREYRDALEKSGYIIVDQSVGIFSAET